MPASFRFDNVNVTALACAVPSYIQKIPVINVENPVYNKKFLKQTGISQRHISITEQSCTDLAFEASKNALDRAGWDAESLDALVFLSQTPDFNIATGNAFVMHGYLGLRNDVLAYDIGLGCSSFPNGLVTCGALLQQKNIKRCLMLCGDVQWHHCLNKQDLLSEQYFIHGEGVAAILLERGPSERTIVDLYTDGKRYHCLFDPFSNVRNAWRKNKQVVLPGGVRYVWNPKSNYMDGSEITLFSTTTVVDAIKNFMNRVDSDPSDYDGLVLHQANLQIVRTIAKRLKFPEIKVPISLDRYANTSGASVPLTIADAYADFSKPKVKLLTCAFGVGLSWGVSEITLETSSILPILASNYRRDDMLAQ